MLDDLTARLAVLELDLVAHDVIHLGGGLPDRDDLEADDRAALAADQLDDLVEPHVDDVDEVALFPLPHADDPVLGLEAAIAVGRAAGHDLGDARVAILATERGADAVELEPHADLEVLQRPRRHEARVRVEAARERGQVLLEDLVRVLLVGPAGHRPVATPELVLGLRLRGLLHLLHEQVVLDPLPPQVLGLGLGRGPAGVVAIADHRLGDGEVVRGVDQPLDQRQPGVDPLDEPAQDLVGEGDVAGLDQVVEGVPLRREAVHVGLREEQLHGVERFEEQLEPALGHVVVDRLAEKVLALEDPADRAGDHLVVLPRLGTGRDRTQRPLRPGRLFADHGQQAAGQQSDQAAANQQRRAVTPGNSAGR